MNMRINTREQRQDTGASITTIPDSAQRQLDQIIHFLCEELEGNLVGIYLHGSLAMCCFNAATSDIDLLAITQTCPSEAVRRAVLTALLSNSLQPHPIEISLVHYAQISPWRHPTPYDLHFSEMYRDHYTRLLADANAAPPAGGVDPDLAAHFTVLDARGQTLHGKPVSELALHIPWLDYLESLRSDFEWSQNAGNVPAVYAVLNACRIWAAVSEDRVLSKAEGAQWALGRTPQQFHWTIKDALSRYLEEEAGTTRQRSALSQVEIERFLQWIRQQVAW
jgi:streptomycin 3"-adenylyltransferase